MDINQIASLFIVILAVGLAALFIRVLTTEIR